MADDANIRAPKLLFFENGAKTVPLVVRWSICLSRCLRNFEKSNPNESGDIIKIFIFLFIIGKGVETKRRRTIYNLFPSSFTPTQQHFHTRSSREACTTTPGVGWSQMISINVQIQPRCSCQAALNFLQIRYLHTESKQQQHSFVWWENTWIWMQIRWSSSSLA